MQGVCLLCALSRMEHPPLLVPAQPVREVGAMAVKDGLSAIRGGASGTRRTYSAAGLAGRPGGQAALAAPTSAPR